MRKLKLLVGLAALLAVPALSAAPALAADNCPPGTTNPSYCPAPLAVTGSPSAIANTTATVTGTVNPQGTTAYYAFQFGTSTTYGSITTVGAVPATITPQPVSGNLTGLTPNTTYHYRLLAVNNGGVGGVGADQTFTTLATVVPKGKTSLSLKATPKRDKTLPFKYTFSGKVKIPAGLKKSTVCKGKVKITLKKGSKTVKTGTANVSKTCTYKKKLTVTNTKKTGKKKGTLKATARFGGNAALKTSKKTVTVKFF